MVLLLVEGGKAHVVADERPQRDKHNQRRGGPGLEALLDGAAPAAAQHRHGGLEHAAAGSAGVAAGGCMARRSAVSTCEAQAGACAVRRTFAVEVD